MRIFIKVYPSIPSLDLFHLQESAFTNKELLSHLQRQTELIELLVRNQQQAGMFNAQAPVPPGAQPPMMAPGAPTFQMPGVLPMAPGVPFGQMVKVPDHRAANIGQPLGTVQAPVRAQPRLMPAGAPVFPVPGVWPNQPLGVSVGHSLSLNVGQPLGMPFAQPMTCHSGQHAMDLTREGQVWPVHDGQPFLQTGGQPFAPQEDHTMAIPLVGALAAPDGQPTTPDGITPSASGRNPISESVQAPGTEPLILNVHGSFSIDSNN